MNKQFEQYIKRAQGVKMTSDEKSRIFYALNQFVQNTPVVSPWSVYFSWQRVMVYATAIVLIFAGSTSYAAQKSLPGDILYPVKISVNEKVLGYIAMSHNAKAEFETKVALNRLDEAEKLEQGSKLTPQSQQTLAASFDLHIGNAKNELNSETSHEKNIADLKLKLNAHKKILSRLPIAVSLVGLVDEDSSDSKVSTTSNNQDAGVITNTSPAIKIKGVKKTINSTNATNTNSTTTSNTSTNVNVSIGSSPPQSSPPSPPSPPVTHPITIPPIAHPPINIGI